MALLPVAGFAQSTPQAPQPPQPPQPPQRGERDRDHDRGPKVPVTFLGVETSPIPSVLSDQLGLAKGFGLVVDYVVPDGPAATAGVLQNDILKMMNDQILMEPNQLAKLVRSYSEGTTVTLTILRKGKDEKVTVKLGKKEVPQRKAFGPGFQNGFQFNFEDGDHEGLLGENFREQMENMKEDLRDQLEDLKELRDIKIPVVDIDRGMIREAVESAHREAARAGEDARRAAREIRIFSEKDGALKSTKLDLGKAQIVFSDSSGEMKIDNVDGKKILTAKDPQGKMLFSGPIDTKEELDKIPAEVRQRFEKLEQKDLPAVVIPMPATRDDGDEDEDDDDGDDDDRVSTVNYQQVCNKPITRPLWGANLVKL